MRRPFSFQPLKLVGASKLAKCLLPILTFKILFESRGSARPRCVAASSHPPSASLRIGARPSVGSFPLARQPPSGDRDCVLYGRLQLFVLVPVDGAAQPLGVVEAEGPRLKRVASPLKGEGSANLYVRGGLPVAMRRAAAWRSARSSSASRSSRLTSKVSPDSASAASMSSISRRGRSGIFIGRCG